MLNTEEKNRLYDIITLLIGEDSSIAAYKRSFNEQTIEVVEKMVETNKLCNANMKSLVVELVGASANFTRGWLKKVVKASGKVISKQEFKGYGCLASVKSRWKSAIINSTI